MSKKSLSIGMIIPLAAAGAVVTAPSASAVHENPGPHGQRVSCTLDADAIRHSDKIKVEFTLNSGQRGLWKVKVEQNQRPIVSMYYMLTHHGYLKIVKMAKDTHGTDRFKATATNHFTHQTCVARDVVKEARRH